MARVAAPVRHRNLGTTRPFGQRPTMQPNRDVRCQPWPPADRVPASSVRTAWRLGEARRDGQAGHEAFETACVRSSSAPGEWLRKTAFVLDCAPTWDIMSKYC